MNLAQMLQMLDQAFAAATPAGHISTAGETNPKIQRQRPMAPQEVRWFAAQGGLVECIIKLPPGALAEPAALEPNSLRIERYGADSGVLNAAVDEILTVADTGERSPYGRRSYRLDKTVVTPAPATPNTPGQAMNDAKFARLSKVALEPGHDFDDRTKAIELVAAERSERAVEVLLQSGSFTALDLLSKWGVAQAAGPLDALIAKLQAAGDRMIDRALVARRRLDAWAIAAA